MKIAIFGSTGFVGKVLINKAFNCRLPGKDPFAHEMAHVFVYRINPDVNGWITEGVAKFEETAVFNDQIRDAGYKWGISDTIKEGQVPEFNELFSGTKITSPGITLEYLFAGTFIDYSSTIYGYQKITEFIKTNDFYHSFGKSENELWLEWVQYLKEKYII